MLQQYKTDHLDLASVESSLTKHFVLHWRGEGGGRIKFKYLDLT